MSLIVGAYPAQPKENQQEFFEGLGGIPTIRGLELPYGPWGGEPWPAGALEGWSAVITAIPGTMQRLGIDGRFGLASCDGEGRRAALEFVSGIRDYAAALADDGHRVEAVELHSAPPGYASVRAFSDSLEEIMGWDWGETRMVVEHCDALHGRRRPEKGFLDFEEEVEVVRSLREKGDRSVGMLVNWARSVIETGAIRTAVDHIRQARTAGVLEGVMFSACSPESTEFGYPWVDAHLPALEVEGAPVSSLLTAKEMADCLTEAGPVAIAGFKIGLGSQTLSTSERVGRVRQMCNLVVGAMPI